MVRRSGIQARPCSLRFNNLSENKMGTRNNIRRNKQALTGKMHRRNHATPESAKRELINHGYGEGVAHPDAPNITPWIKHAVPILAIQREPRPRAPLWHIVTYPATE